MYKVCLFRTVKDILCMHMQGQSCLKFKFSISSAELNGQTFILFANSLAYSEASSLFFWVRCFFRAMRRRLCCSTRGVTSLWILGALVLGFLPITMEERSSHT